MWGFPGTITSVTRLASSWARTLDRLTLDCRDLERSEQLRRLRPQSLTQGMVQGLSEFGISLIGEFHFQRIFWKLYTLINCIFIAFISFFLIAIHKCIITIFTLCVAQDFMQPYQLVYLADSTSTISRKH